MDTLPIVLILSGIAFALLGLGSRLSEAADKVCAALDRQTFKDEDEEDEVNDVA